MRELRLEKEGAKARNKLVRQLEDLVRHFVFFLGGLRTWIFSSLWCFPLGFISSLGSFLFFGLFLWEVGQTKAQCLSLRMITTLSLHLLISLEMTHF